MLPQKTGPYNTTKLNILNIFVNSHFNDIVLLPWYLKGSRTFVYKVLFVQCAYKLGKNLL